MSLRKTVRRGVHALESLGVAAADKVGDVIAEILFGRSRKLVPEESVRRYDSFGVPAYRRGEQRKHPRD